MVLHASHPYGSVATRTRIWLLGSILVHCTWPKLKFPVCCDALGESIKVGKIKKLAVMAHPNKLGRQVLQRYASFVAVRWSRRLEELE